MDSVFGTWRQFLEGEVFTDDGRRIRVVRRILRSTGRRIVRSVAEVSIGTAIAVASVNFVPNSFTQAQAAPIYYENLHAPSPILRNRFKAAREFLQLSQVQAANMLRVSESSVEKFEIGVVEKPTRDTVSRYLALIQLADLYADVVGSKTYLVRSFLNTRSYYYQDKTPIEFAASHDNGVFEMLSTERRKHA